MGELVNLKSVSQANADRRRAEVNTILSRTVRRLEVRAESLFSDLIAAAVADAWSEWSHEQPVGTAFGFSTTMLRETGDARITELCELYEHMTATIEAVRARL